MKLGISSLLALALALIVDSSTAGAQPKKLRPLRIALPSHSVSSTPIYIARTLGIFESIGFEPQILVLEPRAALAALLTGIWIFTPRREPPAAPRCAACRFES